MLIDPKLHLLENYPAIILVHKDICRSMVNAALFVAAYDVAHTTQIIVRRGGLLKFQHTHTQPSKNEGLYVLIWNNLKDTKLTKRHKYTGNMHRLSPKGYQQNR